MKRHKPLRGEQQRLRVAQEAARIMIEHGIGDFLLAKRKAAERLQLRDQTVLPSNAEIEAALQEHQRLFRADSHADEIKALRRGAAALMQLLRDFEPRLVGAVLSGVANPHDEIQIQVFVERPEEVALRLLEHGIGATHAEKKLRYESDRVISYPSFKFHADLQAVEIVALGSKDLRQAPLSPVDGKPMARASLAEVQMLLRGVVNKSGLLHSAASPPHS